jgi:hypothetical protein
MPCRGRKQTEGIDIVVMSERDPRDRRREPDLLIGRLLVDHVGSVRAHVKGQYAALYEMRGCREPSVSNLCNLIVV